LLPQLAAQRRLLLLAGKHLLLSRLEQLAHPAQLSAQAQYLILRVGCAVLQLLQTSNLAFQPALPLLEVVDLRVLIAQQLLALPNLVLQGGLLVLVADGHLLHLPVDDRLPLRLHQRLQLLHVLRLVPFDGSAPVLPPVDLLLELQVLLLVRALLLLEGEAGFLQSLLEAIVFII
jgi:hypothetical protein